MDTTRLSVLPELVVTDHDTCGLVLATGEAYDDEEDEFLVGPYAHVVSIVGTWEDEGDPPGGWVVWESYDARKLRLQFDDCQHSSSHGDAPTMDHIRELVEFADGIDGRCIIHCAAGISRSTAACLIILARLLGEGHEELAVHAVMKIKTSLRPHRNMISMADAILERDGNLYTAYEKVWGKS